MILSNLLLSCKMPRAEELLYKRIAGQVNPKGNELYFSEYTEISFETYFNLLPAGKLKRYTVVEKIRLVLEGQGEFQFQLYEKDEHIQKLIISQKITFKNNRYNASFTLNELLSEESYYFFTLKSCENKSCLFRGCWETNDSPAQSVHLAIGICTFRREEYVRRNVVSLNNYLQDTDEGYNTDGCSVDLLIADNGRTLINESLPATIFPNRNYGGSGGFTRCMIEALKKKCYTHILLQDDDILLEPEVVFRTVSFLRVIRPEYRDVSISGSMFLMDNPTIQYEGGAIWEGHPVAVKGKLDLSSETGLLENGKDEPVDYGAWWYNCIPMKYVESNLPLPFFIKCDDVEFGLQNHARTITLNGIGVWHESFDKKFNAYLEYYASRNALFTEALHPEKYDLRKGIALETKLFFRWLLRQNYNAAKFREKAMEDFRKGFRWLWNLDAETLNKELIATDKAWLEEHAVTEKELEQFGIENIPDDYEKDNFRSAWPVLRYYLIPGSFSKAGQTVQPIMHSHLEAFAGKGRSVQFNRYSYSGYCTEASKSLFWGYMFRYLSKAVPVWLFANSYQKRYKKEVSRTMEKWKEYLSINEQ